MTDHTKEIKELIEAGEKITNNEWFGVTIKDSLGVEQEGILSTKIKGAALEEEVILLSCQEDLDGNAWNNMRFIANAANSRPAIKAMYEENESLRDYAASLEAENKELRKIVNEFDLEATFKRLPKDRRRLLGAIGELEEEKLDLEAENLKLRRRLEIDTCFNSDGEVIPVKNPDSFPDKIECLETEIKQHYEPKIEQLKKRIAELEKWQPIETAPESKMVIVLKDGEVHKAERMLGHYWALPEKDNCGFRHNIKDPECWTPLPTPP